MAHQILLVSTENKMLWLISTNLSISSTYKFGQSSINIDEIIDKYLRTCYKIIKVTRIHNFLDQHAFNFLSENYFFPHTGHVCIYVQGQQTAP